MGTKERKHSKSDGDALFRAAVKDVEPLAAAKTKPRAKPATRIGRSRRKPEVLAQPAPLAVAREFLPAEAGEELSFRRNSVSTSILRDLKRGKIPRNDAIDLHGMRSAAAEVVLREFISHARAGRMRCVRVVHGKGLSSGSRGAILKSCVNHWLPQWDEVLAFCSAPPADGGTGAVYVLLKTR